MAPLPGWEAQLKTEVVVVVVLPCNNSQLEFQASLQQQIVDVAAVSLVDMIVTGCPKELFKRQRECLNSQQGQD